MYNYNLALYYRYRDIVPYDWNRVPVPPYKTKGDSELSDYINASFVSDINTGSPRKYIAAQVIECINGHRNYIIIIRVLQRTLLLDFGQ